MQTNGRVRIKYISYYYFLNECINLSRFDCYGNAQSASDCYRTGIPLRASLYKQGREKGNVKCGCQSQKYSHELEGKCQQLCFLTILWSSFEECRI